MTKNKQNELTDRNESLEKVIQEVRNACAIEGHSAAEWKKTAEAIALKYVPELQPKKRLGRPPIPPEIKSILDILRLTQVGYYRNKDNLTVKEAVEKSPISYDTFKVLRRNYKDFWNAANYKPYDDEDYNETMHGLIEALAAELEEARGEKHRG